MMLSDNSKRTISSKVKNNTKKTCKLLLDDNYKIYFDYGHLTKEGAKYFGNKILEENWFNFK